jgi:histidine phosphotransferase ChpT
LDSDGQEALLAELLCARLCHDLAGAVGAVTAGAELLVEEGSTSPMAAEALDLMAGSAISLAARLRFLRLAVGPANNSASGQARALAEAYFLKGYPQGEWKLDWPGETAGIASADHAKLLLNLILLAQECLPRGGVIAVRPRQQELVTAGGPAMQLGEAAAGLSSPDLSSLTPRGAQGAYAALLARRLGGAITAHKDDAKVSFSLI